MAHSIPKAFVFDAYGTLFDVQSVMRRAETLAPQQGAVLAQLWRTKQLEYTWLQSLMATPKTPREDFAAVTAHALDYALSALLIPLTSEQRQALMDAYLELTPFPDAREALSRLAPKPRIILSNGSLAMLEPLVRHSGLADLIDDILSVDAVDIYKPSPRVYELAVDRLQLAPEEIGFVSCNGWDAAGAKAFGFVTYWINRGGLPVERHAPQPDHALASLIDVAHIATA